MRPWKFVLPVCSAFLFHLQTVVGQVVAPPDSVSVTPANPPETGLGQPQAPSRAEIALPDSLPSAEKKNRFWYVAAPVAVAGAATATYFFLDQDVSDDLPHDQSPFKEFVAEWAEPLGRSVTIVPAFGTLMAYGLVTKDKKARKAGIIGLGTYYVNEGATTQLKKIFNRKRPSTGEDHDNWFAGEPHRSFPSSHTSTAFAAATVVASVYNENKLVAPIAYSVATVVGLSRLYHDQHWASDVIAGAAVGYLSAKAMVFTYEFIEKKWKKRSNLVVVPQVGLNGASATAVLTF